MKCGIGSVIPLETLSIFTANDLDLRVCGIPDVDLKYLKVRGGEMEVIGGREWSMDYAYSLKIWSTFYCLLHLSLSDSHYISCWSNGNR